MYSRRDSLKSSCEIIGEHISEDVLQLLVCLLCRDDSSIFDGLMEEDEKDKAKR